jgi:hypothetical protein
MGFILLSGCAARMPYCAFDVSHIKTVSDAPPPDGYVRPEPAR